MVGQSDEEKVKKRRAAGARDELSREFDIISFYFILNANIKGKELIK